MKHAGRGGSVRSHRAVTGRFLNRTVGHVPEVRFAESLAPAVGFVAAVIAVTSAPAILLAADPAETTARSPSPQFVGAALAALLALCILGAALLGFIWWTGRQVRRQARKHTSKTEDDPLWFLKSLGRGRPSLRDSQAPPTAEEDDR